MIGLCGYAVFQHVCHAFPACPMPDPASILIVTIVSALMSLGVLGSLMRANVEGVRDWVLGSSLSILALTMFAFQGYAWRGLTILAANQLLILALLLILRGCRRFAGMQLSRRWEYAAWLMLLPALGFWTYQVDDINIRIAVISVFHAYVYLSIAWVVYSIRPQHQFSYAYRFVCIAALIGGLVHAARGIAYGVGWVHQDLLLEPSPATTLFLGLGILSLPCLSIGMAMLVHDRLVRQLERMASIDEMTGAFNRRAGLIQAEKALRTAIRNGRPISLAMLDIDRFKAINDARGHAGGDRVLTHFGQLIGNGLRASDLFIRMGGEEFVILCPETSQAEGVLMLERMQRLVRNDPCMLDGQLQHYTFSAGVGAFRPGETLAAWLARVDEALYVAKSRGRDCIIETPPDWRAGTVSASANAVATASAVASHGMGRIMDGIPKHSVRPMR